MDGFINFFKRTGIASNKALNEIKRAIRCTKSGYLGTLDPVASGILPIALGKGTKLLPYFENVPKKYRAKILFGFETDTQDFTGETTLTGPAPKPDERAKMEETLKSFCGEIEQMPPMFSAKKVKGKRLYKMAREGKEVERDTKTVTVHSIELEEFLGETAVFTAVVSRGTYIRTLCEDIGRRMECRAHMGDLIREEVHVFSAGDSVTIERLEEVRNSPEEWLLPLDYPLQFIPRLDATSQEKRTLLNGQAVQWQGEENGPIRLYDDKANFLGIGLADSVLRQVSPGKIFT